MARGKQRSYWNGIQAVLGILALVFAIVIPLQIEDSQRRLQNQGNCTTAVLTLRRDLSSFYDLGDDQRGYVLQEPQADPSKDVTQEQARVSAERNRMMDVRRTAQSSRDTVYVLCREIGNNLSVDPESKPWLDSPSETAAPWLRKNVSDIMRESSLLIDEIARVRPTPVWDFSQYFG